MMIGTKETLDLTQVNDETLMQQIGQRQEAALRELYGRYGKLVFSVANHMLDQRETAEEITLDVFTRVWEKGHTYNPDKAKVRTWLVQLARNRTIDRLRYEGIRFDKDSIQWETTQVSHENHLETEIERKLEQEAVREAVHALPAAQKTILALAYFKGMTQREIAEQLNEPLGTVKGRVRAGMKALKGMLLKSRD